MADSILRIGTTLESTITLKKTNAEVGTILEWFIGDWQSIIPPNLTQAQQNKWKLETAHRMMLQMVMHTAKQNRLSMLRAAQPDLEGQATADTELIDNPMPNP